jgi:signal peptidase I
MNIRPPDRPVSPAPLLPKPPAPSLPSSRPDGAEGPLRTVLSTALLLATALSIALLLNTFVIQSYQVDGQSMEKTLQNDDRLIVNKIPRTLSRITGHQYVPSRGDIIIFNQASLPGFVGEKQLIKRVVGLPGERVVVEDGKITVYNQQYPGGFNPDELGGYQIKKIDGFTTVGGVDVTLQKNQIFVCGDNRPNSEDSRYFGPISTNQIVAKLVLRILPLNQASTY